MPRLISLLKLILMVAIIAPTAAFGSVTSGTVKGVVVDDGGLPIPAVLITVSSENLMGMRSVETDVNLSLIHI